MGISADAYTATCLNPHHCLDKSYECRGNDIFTHMLAQPLLVDPQLHPTWESLRAEARKHFNLPPDSSIRSAHVILCALLPT